MFLSGVRSRSHLVYASAYLADLLRHDGVGHVTVVNLGLGAFLGVQHVTEDDIAGRLPVGPRLSVMSARSAQGWRGRPGEALIYLAVGAPGIKPYLRLRRANRSHLHRVVVDEGLGSYGGWRARWAAGRRQGGRRLKSLVRAVAVTAAQRFFTDERWALYRRTATGWQPDARIVGAFQVQAAQPAAGDARSVVLLSQPWVELGLLSAERYLNVLREVERACAAAGLGLRIRPHPAEDATRYVGMRLAGARESAPGPAELDRSVIDAPTVLGFNSTALINLSAVYGTPVLRLTLPELAAVEAAMSPDQRSLLAAFVPGPVPLASLSVRLLAEQRRGRERSNGSVSGGAYGRVASPQ